MGVVEPLGELKGWPRRRDRFFLHWVRLKALLGAAELLAVSRGHGWLERHRRLVSHIRKELRLSGIASAATAGPQILRGDGNIRRELFRASPWYVVFRPLALVGLTFGLPLAALAIVVTVAVPPLRHAFFPRDLARGAHWVASSAHPGTVGEGIYNGPSPEKPFFVHTNFEHDPWVLFDLGRPTRVSQIVVDNRTDCCTTRSLPLNVELPEGSGWEVICQRRSPFSSFTCRLPKPRTVQRVRFSIGATTYLNLRGVRILP